MKKLLTTMIIATMILIGTTYKVKAATTTAWSTAQVKVGTCHDDTCSYGNNYDTPKTFNSNDLTNPVYSLRWRVKATNGLSSENSYTFSVAYKPTPDSLHFKEIYFKGEGDVSKENITCTNGIDNSGYYTYKCTFTPLEDYSSSDYLYITINFYQAYQTSLATKISKYEERLGTNAVITQQTNEIINQNQQNTQEIIDQLQESATQTNNKLNEVMESQEVCINVSKDDKEENGYLMNNGQIMNDSSVITTKYFKINNQTSIKQTITAGTDSYYRLCYYDLNKTFISCLTRQEYEPMENITIPNGANYVRFSINKNNNRPQFIICKNGNQAIIDNDHNYTTNNTEINNAIDEENELKNEIEQYLTGDWGDINQITIQTEPSNFIWQIVTNLKQINQKISVFFLTILSLGVLKMILNR